MKLTYLKNSRILLNTKYNFRKHIQFCTASIHINSKLQRGIKLTQSYDHSVSDHKLLGKTIGQVLQETTEEFPDTEALVFHRDKRRINYSGLNQQVDQLAASFHGLGLKKGDRVGIWGQNHMEWIITFFAAARSGAILVNVNPAYQSGELKYALNKVGTSALVMTPSFKTSNYYDILKEVAPELSSSKPGCLEAEGIPDLKSVIVTDGPALPGTFSFEEAMAIGGSKEHLAVKDIQQEIQFGDPVNIQFTSGTTGFPKGATLTHHNLVNNAYDIALTLAYTEKDKLCLPVPMYHCFGMILGCLAATISGSTQVYPERGFDAAAALESIEEEKCTSIYGTPAMFIDMLNRPEFNNINFSSLRTGIMAGSPCPIEIMRKVINDMNCKEMTIAYGLTETSPATNQTSRDTPVELRVSSIGKVIPHVEVKIIDEDGKVVPVNTPGELCYRGHCVFQGYWDDEQKTKEAIDENGWFHSGDLGEINEDGYCQVVGRIKDMIIRGGENVYPTEIENFLHNHPYVADVQVVGVPDERLGEEVCAWIKLTRGSECTADEIKEFCKGNISHYKIPKYIEFVDDYPMTVTGKIKKFEIRNTMMEKLGS